VKTYIFNKANEYMGGLAWGGKEIITVGVIYILVKNGFDIRKKDRF
jgi:hypothetical protein